MTSRAPRFAALTAAALSLLFSTSLLAKAKPEPEPRPVSPAEAAAVEVVADFLSRGPVAFHERLDASSPLASLPTADALAEIEARTGPPDGAKWWLQTIVPSLADRKAVFGVEYPSGIDDVLEITLVERNGRFLVHGVRSSAEPSPYAVHTPWSLSESVEEVDKEEPLRLVNYLPFAGGILIALSLVSLALSRARPWVGRLSIVATVAACAFLVHRVSLEIGETSRLAEAAGAVSGAEAIQPLGSLLEWRRALAAGSLSSAPAGVEAEASEVALVWKAQVELRDQNVEQATRTLEHFPLDTDRPMVALLRARAASAEYDEVGSSLAYERAMRLGPGRDELWLETAQWLFALGFEERALTYLGRLPQLGSRSADAWYALATLSSARGKRPEAVGYLGKAWDLAPVPRSEIIGMPSLTFLMRLDEVRAMIPLAAPQEPSFRAAHDAKRRIALPDSSTAYASGSLLHVTIGDRSLRVEGGAPLVEDVEVIDAVLAEKRDEDRALSDLDDLLSHGGSPAALAHPAVRERFMRTATALAHQHRWDDVERLTTSLTASAENVPPDLLFLRGTALRKLNRESDARRLLAEMVASPTMARRSDPRILYQLGEMLAAMELYAPAIRTLERVDILMDDVSLDDRIRQLSMNQRLAERYNEHRSKNFVFHYPDNLDSTVVERLADVMESELERLGRIIPIRSFRPTTVNVLWWNEFRATYTGSDHILGFYDGKITLPLAGISSMEPAVVSLVTHELAHAMIAQSTEDRAPAWIQEGLAQRVEMVPYHANAFNMYENDRLLPISLLNAALNDSIDVDLIGQAYVTSQTAIRFLESKYGAKVMPTLLAGLRDGQSDEAALLAVTGKSMDELEVEFRDWGLAERRVFENRGIVRYDSPGGSKPFVRYSNRKGGSR